MRDLTLAASPTPARRPARHLAVGVALGLAAAAGFGAPGVARAQIAGVLARPRVPRSVPDTAVAADGTVRVGRTGARVPADERQRLGIQAWVDSASAALAQAPPPAIPAAVTGSMFATPAVPDSLRPPPAPVPRVRRGRRPALPPASAVAPSARPG